jgi:hypothetical protein
LSGERDKRPPHAPASRRTLCTALKKGSTNSAHKRNAAEWIGKEQETEHAIVHRQLAGNPEKRTVIAGSSALWILPYE